MVNFLNYYESNDLKKNLRPSIQSESKYLQYQDITKRLIPKYSLDQCEEALNRLLFEFNTNSPKFKQEILDDNLTFESEFIYLAHFWGEVDIPDALYVHQHESVKDYGDTRIISNEVSKNRTNLYAQHKSPMLNTLLANIGDAKYDDSVLNEDEIKSVLLYDDIKNIWELPIIAERKLKEKTSGITLCRKIKFDDIQFMIILEPIAKIKFCFEGKDYINYISASTLTMWYYPELPEDKDYTKDIILAEKNLKLAIRNVTKWHTKYFHSHTNIYKSNLSWLKNILLCIFFPIGVFFGFMDKFYTATRKEIDQDIKTLHFSDEYKKIAINNVPYNSSEKYIKQINENVAKLNSLADKEKKKLKLGKIEFFIGKRMPFIICLYLIVISLAIIPISFSMALVSFVTLTFCSLLIYPTLY